MAVTAGDPLVRTQSSDYDDIAAMVWCHRGAMRTYVNDQLRCNTAVAAWVAGTLHQAAMFAVLYTADLVTAAC